VTEIWLKSPRGFGQTAPKCGQKRAVFRHHNNLVFWPLIQQRFRILVEAITAVNWCSGAYTCKKTFKFPRMVFTGPRMPKWRTISRGCLHRAYQNTAVRSLTCHTATGTHMPCSITQCYLPPDRGDIPVFTLAEAGTRLSDPGGMQRPRPSFAAANQNEVHSYVTLTRVTNERVKCNWVDVFRSVQVDSYAV